MWILNKRDAEFIGTLTNITVRFVHAEIDFISLQRFSDKENSIYLMIDKIGSIFKPENKIGTEKI